MFGLADGAGLVFHLTITLLGCSCPSVRLTKRISPPGTFCCKSRTLAHISLLRSQLLENPRQCWASRPWGVPEPGRLLRSQLYRFVAIYSVPTTETMPTHVLFVPPSSESQERITLVSLPWLSGHPATMAGLGGEGCRVAGAKVQHRPWAGQSPLLDLEEAKTSIPNPDWFFESFIQSHIYWALIPTDKGSVLKDLLFP